MSKSFITLAALSLAVACSAAARQNPMVESRADTSVAAPAEALPAPGAEPERRIEPVSIGRRASLQDAVSCDVRARPSVNGVLIEARLHANRSLSGEYQLVITKSGGGNSSDVTQGGPFTAAAGSSLSLGQTELSVERNGRVRAVLTLREGNREICRHEFRS